MTTGSVDLTELAPTPAAVVRGHVSAPQISGFLSAAFTDVLRLLEEQHRAPAGPVVTSAHRGPYETVGATYDALTAWMTAHGYRPSGEAWESYLDEPDAAEPRTLVSAPCVPV